MCGGRCARGVHSTDWFGREERLFELVYVVNERSLVSFSGQVGKWGTAWRLDLLLWGRKPVGGWQRSPQARVCEGGQPDRGW